MQGSAIHSAITLELNDDRIRRVYVLRNPEKLARLDPLPVAIFKGSAPT